MIHALVVGGLAIAVALIVAIVGLLIWRALAKAAAAKALAISTPNGIDEAMFVPIGGIDQWVTIRGENRSNPVLFFLHGGPGAAMSPFAGRFRPFERDFVLVQWDQRGAGRTYGRNRRAPDAVGSLKHMTADGIELAEWLRTHLGKDRLILFGLSWGSVLGVHMVKARPDLFFAFVSSGQVVNMQAGEAMAYAQVLAKAKARGDAKRIAALEKSGAPPYHAARQIMAQRRVAGAYEPNAPSPLTLMAGLLTAPRYGLRDGLDFVAGIQATQKVFLGPDLSGALLSIDLNALGTDFAVPVYVLQGDQDDYTPAPLARAWFDTITAPGKAYVSIEGYGHMAVAVAPERFRDELVERVRPLALTE